MRRTLVGAVRFQDARLGQLDEFRVFLVEDPWRLELVLEEDVLGVTGIGGDCEISFDDKKAREFLQILSSAADAAKAGDPIRWERIGSMRYTWSDRDEKNTPGEVMLEACRGTVRLTIRPSRADRSEYLAAMREDALHRLISLIKSSIIV